MRMGASLSASPVLTQRTEQRQRLSARQRQALATQQTGLLIQLAAALRSEKWEPSGNCPGCAYTLEAREILAGFLDVVDDFTTECPKCGQRFEPRVICTASDHMRVELPFICGVQARHKLRLCAGMSPEEIARAHPGPFRSAIIAFGTLRAMFALFQPPVIYQFEEVPGWRAKVMPFLGEMPDSVIARCVGVGVGVISRLRRRNNIDAYCKRTAAEALQS